MAKQIRLFIDPVGTVRYIHDDDIDLAGVGRVELRRASHVDVTADLRPEAQAELVRRGFDLDALPNKWWADILHQPGIVILGPFDRRQEGLEAEVRWLEQNRLRPAPALP